MKRENFGESSENNEIDKNPLATSDNIARLQALINIDYSKEDAVDSLLESDRLRPEDYGLQVEQAVMDFIADRYPDGASPQLVSQVREVMGQKLMRAFLLDVVKEMGKTI